LIVTITTLVRREEASEKLIELFVPASRPVHTALFRPAHCADVDDCGRIFFDEPGEVRQITGENCRRSNCRK
jgi:hypothetical protein